MVGMDELVPGRTIDDTNIAAAQGSVRALIVARLEQTWQAVAPHLDGRIEAAGYKPDPRMVQAAIHVLDRLGKLYRLELPAKEAEHVPTVAVNVAVVEASLLELEARMSPPPAG